jgi:predicted AAA+ superfamily ATPase
LEYKQYLIVGGMPASVLSYVTPNATLKNDEIRQMILNSYIADMAKYATSSEKIKIIAAYESLQMQLARDNKKFQFKLIKSGARASQYGDAIDWLISAGIVNKCTKCAEGFMPPSAYQDLASFKLYYSDTGLLAAKTNMTLEAIDYEESNHFRGIFTENYAACALKANKYELLYWESDGTAEVDFLIIKDSRVLPVECKAATHVKSKSLMVYRDKYKPAYCIRISARNFGLVDGIKSVPLYAVFCV